MHADGMKSSICIGSLLYLLFLVFHQCEPPNEVTNTRLTCDPLKYRLSLTCRDNTTEKSAPLGDHLALLMPLQHPRLDARSICPRLWTLAVESR